MNYLVTIEELGLVDEKLALNPLSIDHFIVANRPEYDEVLDRISQRTYTEAVDVSPVLGGRFVTIE